MMVWFVFALLKTGTRPFPCFDKMEEPRESKASSHLIGFDFQGIFSATASFWKENQGEHAHY
jgi:hypothetical protein